MKASSMVKNHAARVPSTNNAPSPSTANNKVRRTRGLPDGASGRVTGTSEVIVNAAPGSSAKSPDPVKSYHSDG